MVEFEQVKIDKTKNVRNCATLCELLDFPVSKKLEAKIRRDIKYYAAKLNNLNMWHSLISLCEIGECHHYNFALRNYTQQANAFLIMAMAKIEGKVTQTLSDICDDLYGPSIPIRGDSNWTTPGVPKDKRIGTLTKM